ncbi:MAG: murein biosynthesis integral membrane protein MurJ [Anaerolineaceae bacterium]|nr:murein biosynthesis integral membrane protein MurJ [Anaerolineaceae bacterium]MDD4041898.1 murein biosynthesis integral membrane protein MurJ [Anaerolineaceae bacterium]MDD4578221.1 murein biosynthesis integral membrane protein MurJ [Anaerolineaceae bacterium]
MKKLSRLTKVSLLLAGLFGIDKILGVARQMIISRQFGLSAELDVFNAANNLPDMLFMLISGGALAIAFIPILSEVLTQKGREKAWALFSNILNIAFIITAIAAVIVAILARPLITNELGIAPGFSEAQTEASIRLLRLNLISTLIFSLSGLVMAGLQANQHFLLPALAPIFYDLGQIFGALFLAPTEGYTIGSITLPAFGLGVDGLVYGVIIGAALHLLIQIPGLIRYKFKWSPKINIHDPETRKVFRMMAPRLVSMFCIQLIFLAQDNFASRLETGSVTALTYGWWIMQVPQTLIGTSIATAILPTLSEFFSSERFDEMKEKIERAAQVMLALTIPIAIVAGVVLTPAVQAFLGLDPLDTARVVDVSRIFLIGIVGHSLVELFVRSFYAMQKPKYPLIGAVATLIVFILFSLILSPLLQARGVAAANTLSYSLQAVLLLVLLNPHLVSKLKLSKSLLRGIVGALVGGAVAFAVLTWTPRISDSLIGAAAGGVLGLLVAAVVIRPELIRLREL